MNPQKFYDKVYDWILYKGPSLIIAIIILIVGLWAIRVIRKWLTKGMHKREFDPSLQPFLLSVIIIALQILLALTVMNILGIPLTIFTAVIGAFGIAAGLALSGTLQNFASGVLILLLKPFRVGDAILAQGQEGIVSSIQIFYTVVTTYDNRTVIFPNSKLSNEVIINISRQGKRRLDIEMKFPFGTDINQVKDIITQFGQNSKAVLKNPISRIGISTIDPDGFKLMISFWISAHNFIDSKLKLQEELIEHLKQAGLKLPGM